MNRSTNRISTIGGTCPFSTGATLAGLQLEKRELGRLDLALELDRGYQHPFGDVFHLDVLQFDDHGQAEPVGGQRFTMDFNLLRIVGKGSDWKFLDAGGVPDREWSQPGYDDSKWLLGTAPFGYGRSDVATGLRGGAGGRPATVYFRQTFEVPDPTFYRSLALNYLQDDGIAVYLNGREILRANLPDGPLTPDTRARVNEQGAAARACRSLRLDNALALLVPGRNVLAAEVHPAGGAVGGSNRIDLTFDVELAGNVPDAPYQPPTVEIAAPEDGTRVPVGANVPIVADVIDPDGDLAEVRIYADGRLLARLTERPFTALFREPGPGSHRVSVEAQDTFAHVTRHEAVFNVVSNLLPVASITQPQPDTVVGDNTPVMLAAEAFDLDGLVQRVNFYVKPHNRFDSPKRFIGSSTMPPYRALAENLPPDRYLALAEAVDNRGAVGYSLSSHFLVVSPVIRAYRQLVAGVEVVRLEWDAQDAVLETATSLPGEWRPLVGAVSPHLVPVEGRAQFFRLRLSSGHNH